MMKSASFVLADGLNEENERTQQRSIRRNLRDKSNPLGLPESLFTYLLNVLSDSLPQLKKSFAVPPIVKLSACLRFFAEGGYQTGVGKDHEVGLAQSSFSEALSTVLNIFETELCPIWIKTQISEKEKRKTVLNFFEKFNVHGVVGCIDGTHIRITAPPDKKHLYYNRKGFYCINVLLVCDDQMRICFVDATHPGACHDSLVWKTSELRSWFQQQYVNGERNSWLLGDALYPFEPWLLTPYRINEEQTVERKLNNNKINAI